MGDELFSFSVIENPQFLPNRCELKETNKQANEINYFPTDL